MGCVNVTTNAGGIPYLSTSNVTISTTSVDLALGWNRRGLSPMGYFTIRISDAIPADTTTTLPVTITFNGITRNLTLFDGTQVTAAEILNGTGVLLIFNDRFNNVLQLISRTTV